MRLSLSAIVGAVLFVTTPLPVFAGQNTLPGMQHARGAPVLGEARIVAAPVAGRGPSYRLVFERDPNAGADRFVRVTLAPVGGRGPSLVPDLVHPMRTASAR